MIVLDEQLMRRDLREAIAHWYRGKVLYITELRPDTIIKDEAIPSLLQSQSSPTLVTINEKDFWRKLPAI